MHNELNNKNQIVSSYNLRKRPDGSVKKPVVYNLRPRYNSSIKKMTNKSDCHEIKKRKREPLEEFIELEDDDMDHDNEFTWDDFNHYQSPHASIDDNNNDKKNWVSATSVKNYLLDEPLIDWFDLYYLEKGFNDGANVFMEEKQKKKQDLEDEMKKLNVFFKMGNKFEEEVMKFLRNKYPGQVKKVVTKSVTSSMCDITLQYMKEGVPMIEQAALYNYKNKTYGVADILIRSDWIGKLFETVGYPYTNCKAPVLSGNYHYVVIDIKWTTMYLCANGTTLRNSNRFPAYKGQLAIYNAAVGLMQGYTPNSSFVLTKSWNYNGGKAEGYNCFTRLGHIEYNDFDNKYIKKTFDAINWVRNVRYNGHQWSVSKPSIPELYPNMCNRYDTPYHNVKKDLAENMKELTQIWMVGVKHRKIAHEKGIYSWDDVNCCSENIGINGKKIGPVVNKIIDINRTSSPDLIRPKFIENNTGEWKTKNELDFFIDFEGITGCLYYQDINLQNSKQDNQIVFMVGIGYEDDNGKWNYNCFKANSISRIEEKRVINSFRNLVEDRINNYMLKYNIQERPKAKFFHWSHAEKSILNMLNKRHDNEWTVWRDNVVWIDMCKIFTDVPIVIKGAKKFNLKEIAKSMASHNMIQTNWHCDGPENGLDAMLEAIEYYQYFSGTQQSNEETMKYNRLMDSIQDYNEVDCKVLWEIVSYLRKNNT